jgi:transposase
MDRPLLERLLGQGLSLAEIGRRVGLHEATVGYWVRKYDLEAVNRAKHAPRGGMARDELKALVDAGMSTAQIADALGRSKTTVRHWLREYGLSTLWAQRRGASKEGRARLVLECPRHGMTDFGRRAGGGYRCTKCRADAVARRRRKVKRLLVEEAGGACNVCGYDRCVAALHFHHLDRAEKSFSLSHRGVARSIAKARLEASKCLLLCSNCHAEVEAGLITLPARAAPHIQCRLDSDLPHG